MSRLAICKILFLYFSKYPKLNRRIWFETLKICNRTASQLFPIDDVLHFSNSSNNSTGVECIINIVKYLTEWSKTLFFFKGSHTTFPFRFHRQFFFDRARWCPFVAIIVFPRRLFITVGANDFSASLEKLEMFLWNSDK